MRTIGHRDGQRIGDGYTGGYLSRNSSPGDSVDQEDRVDGATLPGSATGRTRYSLLTAHRRE